MAWDQARALMRAASSGSSDELEILATAPPGRWTASGLEGEFSATSATMKAGTLSLRSPVVASRFCLATQEAKVGYLIPHCFAKAGPLRLLVAKASRTWPL